MSIALATLAEKSGTKFILALFVDLRGKPCAKLVPVEAVDQLATEGVGFAGYAVGAIGQEPKAPGGVVERSGKGEGPGRNALLSPPQPA